MRERQCISNAKATLNTHTHKEVRQVTQLNQFQCMHNMTSQYTLTGISIRTYTKMTRERCCESEAKFPSLMPSFLINKIQWMLPAFHRQIKIVCLALTYTFFSTENNLDYNSCHPWDHTAWIGCFQMARKEICFHFSLFLTVYVTLHPLQDARYTPHWHGCINPVNFAKIGP